MQSSTREISSFGEKRLRDTLQHAARWHAPAIRDSLVHAVTRFMGNHHQTGSG